MIVIPHRMYNTKQWICAPTFFVDLLVIIPIKLLNYYHCQLSYHHFVPYMLQCCHSIESAQRYIFLKSKIFVNLSYDKLFWHKKTFFQKLFWKHYSKNYSVKRIFAKNFSKYTSRAMEKDLLFEYSFASLKIINETFRVK